MAHGADEIKSGKLLAGARQPVYKVHCLIN